MFLRARWLYPALLYNSNGPLMFDSSFLFYCFGFSPPVSSTVSSTHPKIGALKGGRDIVSGFWVLNR